jgi:hypothetical protein
MLLRRGPHLLRLLLLAAFLLAQQSALAHQIWHSAANGGKPAAAGEQGKKGNPLCEQHEALGTVLGILSAGAVQAPAVDQAPIHFPAASAPAARVSSLSPVSRGPPASL